MKNVYGWAVTVALGGFLFGFDTAVISGVNDLLQAQWNLSDLAKGQMVGSALYGTVIGALVGGIPADRYGRRASLLGIAALFLLSAVGSAAAQGVWSLSVARFIGGLGVGASSVVAPLYITEVAPARLRGRLVAAFQANLVIGILVAYFSNYVIDAAGLGEHWRLMLGVEILPALLFLVLLGRVPRSPRWLLTKAGRPEEARTVLQRIYGDGAGDIKAEQEFTAIRASDTTSKTVAFGTFFSRKYRRPITYAFLFALFNQISGINAVIYYAPTIFEDAGLGRESALLSSVGIGVVNVVFTLLGMYLIDRSGRKKLMYIGSVGYIVSLLGVAYAFGSGNTAGAIVPGWLFLFIASHAIGQGAVIWVFLSEIFGNEVRSLGASFGSGVHWVGAALIGAYFPWATETFATETIFGFFAACMVGQLVWVHFVMPETRGVELEELQGRLVG